ncbi:MAG: PEGA domain-containing protein [Brevinematia bacterium]
MRKLILLSFFILLISSCAQKSVKPEISEPKLKTDIKVSIYITNISQLTNLSLEYVKRTIEKNITTFDFSEYYQEATNEEYTYPETNSNVTTTETQKLDSIDLDLIIKGTLERNLKKFIKSLGKYNPNLDEIKIYNIDEIESEIIRKFPPGEIVKYLYTNTITNSISETNYYSLGEDTNRVKIEIIEKEVYVSELKLSNEFLSKYIISNKKWILKITNGIPFNEGVPPDFSIAVFYDVKLPKILNNYLENIDISLFVVVSNNTSSNFIVFKTNLSIYEFLVMDYKIFNNIRAFMYNYNAGGIIIDILPRDYDIYLDNFYLGKGKSDLKIVSEGIHRITISKNTFSVNRYVFVKKGVVNIYKEDMTYNSLSLCNLKIDSMPSNADLFIENEYIGRTPTNITLPYGKYRIWLNKDKFESYKSIDLISKETNMVFVLSDLNDKRFYNTLLGSTILLGTATLSSIFLYFWADSQERYYSFLYSKENKVEYLQMKDYYYYFKDNMRTTAIVGTIGTFVLWGLSLGVESEKFSIRLNIPF